MISLKNCFYCSSYLCLNFLFIICISILVSPTFYTRIQQTLQQQKNKSFKFTNPYTNTTQDIRTINHHEQRNLIFFKENNKWTSRGISKNNIPDYKQFFVEESYTGERMKGDQISLEFILEMIEDFKSLKPPHQRYLYKIFQEIRDLFESLDTVVDIEISENTNFTVVGDLHGQFFDLLHIFELNGLPSEANCYLFNGDLIDRGDYSLEILVTVFSFKLLYPNSIHLNRGNHETETLNSVYGFYQEVLDKLYGDSISYFNSIFDYLPLVTILNKKIFICHGGLFLTDDVTINEIRNITRSEKSNRMYLQNPFSIFTCLLWSDPGIYNGRQPSVRHTSLVFGPDVTENFLKLNNLDLIIRSHQVEFEGYKIMHKEKLITVFSSPNYMGLLKNKGAIIRFDSQLNKKIIQFDSVDREQHKNIKRANAFN
ncbi:serine/threonine-protein phosphatase 5 [Anaeramoeba flamelloides]|uniref:Serine/threonine-protein phosphatase n=1 Tax=Anaeramoeba flamelloides TaxID=1746091 RepID=A0ABQ8XXW2_9EUKA|nr:serine/threonine-protein phosphatase 5 [Anaeramoeba flamelloides]